MIEIPVSPFLLKLIECVLVLFFSRNYAMRIHMI